MEVRQISKASIEKAFDLVKKTQIGKKRNRWEKQLEKEEESEQKMSQHCVYTPFGQKRRQAIVTGFAKQLALTELRSYLRHHYWKEIQDLFPTILSYDNILEPLIWRYMLIILLHSPSSNPTTMRQFLELCLGNRGLDEISMLEKLLYIK